MYFLGIDAGGTKMVGILADISGQVVVAAKAGPANVGVVGSVRFAERLQELKQALLNQAGPGAIRWTTLGVAGAGRKQARQTVQNALQKADLQHATVLTDAELLYFAAHGEKPGLLISSGTGSVCLVGLNDGVLHQLGGWGYLLGDEGSGYDVGRQAIRHVLTEAQAGEARSPFARALLSHYGVSDHTELVSLVYASENPQHVIASSARVVFEFCHNTNVVAREIVANAAEALVRLAVSGCAQIQTPPPYRSALGGSLFADDSPVRQSFLAKSKAAALTLEVVNPSLAPAAAAVVHAMSCADVEASGLLVQRLREASALH